MFPEFLLACRGGLGLLVVVATLVLASCYGVTHQRFEPVRYRLTAVVKTPEGLRSGSSVIEVTWAMSRTSPPLGGSGYELR